MLIADYFSSEPNSYSPTKVFKMLLSSLTKYFKEFLNPAFSTSSRAQRAVLALCYSPLFALGEFLLDVLVAFCMLLVGIVWPFILCFNGSEKKHMILLGPFFSVGFLIFVMAGIVVPSLFYHGAIVLATPLSVVRELGRSNVSEFSVRRGNAVPQMSEAIIPPAMMQSNSPEESASMAAKAQLELDQLQNAWKSSLRLAAVIMRKLCEKAQLDPNQGSSRMDLTSDFREGAVTLANLTAEEAEFVENLEVPGVVFIAPQEGARASDTTPRSEQRNQEAPLFTTEPPTPGVSGFTIHIRENGPNS